MAHVIDEVKVVSPVFVIETYSAAPNDVEGRTSVRYGQGTTMGEISFFLSSYLWYAPYMLFPQLRNLLLRCGHLLLHFIFFMV
jgi:hypothetical protein